MHLTRDAILSCDDSQREAHDVPEWGGQIYLRAFTGAEGRAIAKTVADDDPDRGNAQLVVLGACDEHGQRLFTDEDVDALLGKSLRVVQRLAHRLLEINGFLDSNAETEKNSETTPS